MKIIIDIPEEEYNTGQLVHYFGCYSDKLDLVIYNGTPLPEQQHIDKSAMMYEIYVKGKRVASFAGNTTEGQQIIVFLEKKGVKIEW